MGYRMNRQSGSVEQLREELERVRRHLTDTAAQLDAAASQLPSADMLSDRGTEPVRSGSDASSAVIGLELAIADVQDRARQLQQALEDITQQHGESMQRPLGGRFEFRSPNDHVVPRSTVR